ncbi:MAG: hypothetical protein ABI882_03820 [Acidobacteriota bacterium]
MQPVTQRYSSAFLSLLILLTVIGSSGCYRPGVATRPKVDAGLGQLAYDALAPRSGTVIIIDPRTGRVLSRVGHSADLQFESPVFELAQLITAYAALSSGAINEKTVLPCDGETINVVEAIGRDCHSFFRVLSEKTTLEAFARSAEALGFVYYGVENSADGSRTVRPIGVRLPTHLERGEFAELAAAGQVMLARDLHFVNLVTTLASGRTTAERFADYISTTARAPAPLMESLNAAALAIVKKGLTRAVESGELAGAATFSGIVAAKAGGSTGRAVLISYAPANNPDVCLVVSLPDGGRRAAADVAGRFYQTYFIKRK